jgi:hypothetical protein
MKGMNEQVANPKCDAVDVLASMFGPNARRSAYGSGMPKVGRLPAFDAASGNPDFEVGRKLPGRAEPCPEGRQRDAIAGLVVFAHHDL